MSEPAPVRITIATAGHVDHGKTRLVAALTGHDTDRLPEEKSRGLSIEPGFAPLQLAGAPPISIVDVPGHERFVRQMVAGASGVDAFLLCVAADDGVMPQTREHLMILNLLGIARGVVAITKRDRADPESATDQVRALVGEVATVPVCAPDGSGLDALRGALAAVAEAVERRMHSGPGRLYVDRAFSVAGAGTVATGTLWGSPIFEGDRVRVEPGGTEFRVRGLQVHDQKQAVVASGRVAVNLSGAHPGDVPRGVCLLAADATVEATDRISARVAWHGPTPLRTRRRLQAHLGTAEVSARCRLPASAAIAPGQTGDVELLLERPIAAMERDRLILRDGGATVGGGVVVPAESRTREPVLPAGPSVAEALTERVTGALADVGLAGTTETALVEALGARTREVRAALRSLGESGSLARVGARFVDAETLAAAVGAARAELERRPLAISELRALWRVGRAQTVAIAEHMDADGITERRGNVRILIPRSFANDS